MKVTDRRTKVDFARCMKELVDIYFPEAEVIKLVMDNLNIHTPAALYEVFEPEEARRIINKLEIHYTPKHGSWLNMVEGELQVYRPDGERFATYVEVIEQRELERQRAEQAEQAQRDAIPKLLAMGLSVEQVAEALSLPVEMVRAVVELRG